MKPIKTVFFLIGVFLLLAVAMWATPAGGIKVGAFTFHLPSFSEMFLDEGPQYVDVSHIVEEQFDIDSVLMPGNEESTPEILAANYDSLVAKIHRIELNDTARQNLYGFFKRLEKDTLVRIMHYGDSQIEGDRMTAFIRNRLQKKFGGTGIGLRPALQPYDFVLSAVQENSGNWMRYPLYGRIDSTIQHNKYGPMAAFSRFAPPQPDTLATDSLIYYEASLAIEKASVALDSSRVYKHFKLYYGNTSEPVSVQLFSNDTFIAQDTLLPTVDFARLEIDLPDTTSQVSVHFSGYDSPDIYGFEVASKSGVIMDNIALRGSSGVFFTRNDFLHSQKVYKALKPDLFILQFGGNTVPYLTEAEKIVSYGRWFRAQIARLKKTCPHAAIIVIGPSDMSTKQKEFYVTYEHLPGLVETLKQVALSEGCGYWDMFDAMGGKNSMPSWVNADPELARPDYVHFSMRGARLIANMFYNALIFEYNNYLQNK